MDSADPKSITDSIGHTVNVPTNDEQAMRLSAEANEQTAAATADQAEVDQLKKDLWIATANGEKQKAAAIQASLSMEQEHKYGASVTAATDRQAVADYEMEHAKPVNNGPQIIATPPAAAPPSASAAATPAPSPAPSPAPAASQNPPGPTDPFAPKAASTTAPHTPGTGGLTGPEVRAPAASASQPSSSPVAPEPKPFSGVPAYEGLQHTSSQPTTPSGGVGIPTVAMPKTSKYTVGSLDTHDLEAVGGTLDTAPKPKGNPWSKFIPKAFRNTGNAEMIPPPADVAKSMTTTAWQPSSDSNHTPHKG